MQQGRRWMGVALSATAAVALCLGGVSSAAAGEAAPEVLDWRVTGAVEAGGIYSFGDRGSAKFNQYRDMGNGFVGEFELQGEHTKAPYFFELYGKNPARDDQQYEGAFGRYGLFTIDLDWARIPHVLSNNAHTIFQDNGGDFTLTPRASIATTFQSGGLAPTNAARTNIQSLINGLDRPVDLKFNTDVGDASFKFTPTEALRFDLSYGNRHVDGTRPLSAPIDSAARFGARSMVVDELAIPLDQMTHEAKFQGEYATQAFAVQAGYTASIFANEFQSYSWDNPVETAGILSRGLVSAPPNNIAHTWDLTARGSLPFWRTTASGAFSYTMQRQDQTFVNNLGAAGGGFTPSNADDSGRTSPNAKANLVLGNFRLTSRPLNNVTTTAFYRYFERQNDSDFLSFAHTFANNADQGAQSTLLERYTKQNAGLDIGWRPLRLLSLKGGYEYEHWNRGDIDEQSFNTDEHIAKAAADITPNDWFLGRVTYLYGSRSLHDYTGDPTGAGSGPNFFKFNYANRVRNRVDALLQFSRWETVTPSLSFGYTDDNYNKSAFGLTDDRGFSAGAGLTWVPINWLTFTGNYSYEYHLSRQNVFRTAATPWQSDSRDQFHIFDVGTTLNLVPKRLSLTLDYGVTFGYSDIKGRGLAPGSTAGDFPRVDNVLQTARITALYRLTDKLSLRGGFAYERYTERNFLLDPMQPFMGFYDPSASGAASVWLGANAPNYEAYIFSALVRYEFY